MRREREREREKGVIWRCWMGVPGSIQAKASSVSVCKHHCHQIHRQFPFSFMSLLSSVKANTQTFGGKKLPPTKICKVVQGAVKGLPEQRASNPTYHSVKEYKCQNRQRIRQTTVLHVLK